jgi:DNA-binding NarL/FixJ family response regulator
MDPNKYVFIVEDMPGQRIALHDALERRGFTVQSAGKVAEAREKAERMGEKIDVAVLDMKLEDTDAPTVTGADIGLEIAERQANFHPEFLIQSAYSETHYYELALKLGAAAYLPKAETTQEELIRHVRALALRRALRVDRPDAPEEIGEIAEHSKNFSAAVKKVCREILAPQFSSTLGAPFLLLLTDETGTLNCAGTAGVPQDYNPAYKILQAMAHGNANRSDPYVLDKKKVPAPPDGENIYEALDGAAFLPLSSIEGCHLSLGIVQEPTAENRITEDAKALAKVLAEYFRQAMIEHLLKLLSHWTELVARRTAILGATSQFCLYFGQEQQSILTDAVNAREIEVNSFSHKRLMLLGEDLMETGQVLMPLETNGSEAKADGRPAQGPPSITVAQVVRDAWEDVGALPYSKDLEFVVEGDCRAQAARDDVRIAASRLLQWMIQRRIDVESGTKPLITVRCSEEAGVARISFEDRSRRLSERLRAHLFSPFSLSVMQPSGENVKGPGLYLPLYLAKMLVEEKNGGWLEDHSDEIPGEVGHRLVMRFPLPEQRPPAEAG